VKAHREKAPSTIIVSLAVKTKNQCLFDPPGSEKEWATRLVDSNLTATGFSPARVRLPAP